MKIYHHGSNDMLIKDTEEWANNLFRNAKLGDERRSKRLMKLSHLMASNTGSSIVKASGSRASIEGAYRFLRNDKIDANDIASAGFSSLLPDLTLSNKMLALDERCLIAGVFILAKHITRLIVSKHFNRRVCIRFTISSAMNPFLLV